MFNKKGQALKNRKVAQYIEIIQYDNQPPIQRCQFVDQGF